MHLDWKSKYRKIPVFHNKSKLLQKFECELFFFLTSTILVQVNEWLMHNKVPIYIYFNFCIIYFHPPSIFICFIYQNINQIIVKKYIKISGWCSIFIYIYTYSRCWSKREKWRSKMNIIYLGQFRSKYLHLKNLPIPHPILCYFYSNSYSHCPKFMLELFQSHCLLLLYFYCKIAIEIHPRQPHCFTYIRENFNTLALYKNMRHIKHTSFFFKFSYKI